MNVDAIRHHCLSFPQAKENLQWGETLCFKVRGKLFAMVSLDAVPPSLTLKSAPERFSELIENEDVVPARYVGRYKWVSLQRLDALPWPETKELIEISYNLVAEKAAATRRISGRKSQALRRNSSTKKATAASRGRFMKKTSSATTRRSSGAAGAPKEVEAYFARVPEPARATLTKMRAQIRSLVPCETTETMSYGLPTFKYKGALVAIASFKDHCSFFPYNSSLIAEFKNDLKNFSTSKGTIRFSVEKPLPAALVKKLVKARIEQNETRQKKKR